jgi:hypothetical protein
MPGLLAVAADINNFDTTYSIHCLEAWRGGG